MVFDKKSELYFNKRVKQIFVYLTNRCQLNCAHCLYKPLLSQNSEDLSFSTLMDLLKKFKDFGAYKISFLGGEPTLYHDKTCNKVFKDVVCKARNIGYSYIRVDTNGQFDGSFLEDCNLKQLNEITFSLDGYDKETNDIVRGQGSFEKCVKNVRNAVLLGYNVQITACIHKYTCSDELQGDENLDKMILFAQDLGAKSINFHPILKVGVMRDNWINNTDIDPIVWVKVYRSISKNVMNGRYSINVRLPMRFIEDEALLINKEPYVYCPLEMGERALIMPDGQIKVCAFTIGSPSCIAHFTEEKVTYEKEHNELSGNELFCNENTNSGICYKQKKFGHLAPLCMSYKPNQRELVWDNIVRNEKGERSSNAGAYR